MCWPLFIGQEVLSVGRQDPYVRTHPLSRDRLRAVEAFVAARASGEFGETLEAQYWFARSVAKLSAFLRDPRWTLRQTRGQNDEISLLRRAIAHHRSASTDDALSADGPGSWQLRPNDPYYQRIAGHRSCLNPAGSPKLSRPMPARSNWRRANP